MLTFRALINGYAPGPGESLEIAVVGLLEREKAGDFPMWLSDEYAPGPAMFY
jgi:hypothetical protein